MSEQQKEQPKEENKQDWAEMSNDEDDDQPTE